MLLQASPAHGPGFLCPKGANGGTGRRQGGFQWTRPVLARLMPRPVPHRPAARTVAVHRQMPGAPPPLAATAGPQSQIGPPTAGG